MHLWIFAALLITGALCRPQQGRPRNPMHNPDLFEGDILLIGDPEDRNALPNDKHLWPNGTIPFVLKDKVVQNQRSLILRAMQHITDKTDGCIRFVERTNERDFIGIFAGYGCYSVIGYYGVGEQKLSLGYGCHYYGTFVHELMHAVGFFHEHNRCDRDDYLTIHWDNIYDDFKKDFNKLLPNNARICGKFDYHSIMMYGEYALTKYHGAKTMEAKDGVTRLKDPNRKPGLTDEDVIKVKRLYKCGNVGECGAKGVCQ